MDHAHSGPPDTVLPWLESQQQQQQQQPAPRGAETGGDGGEEGGEGDGEDERRPLDATLDVCGPEAGVGSVSEETGGGGGGGGASREHALVQEEEKEVGVVALSVYLAYWAAVGSLLAPAIFVALFLMQGGPPSTLLSCFYAFYVGKTL